MTETTLGIWAVVALGVCVVDALFWMLGGRRGKWKRRFVGAGIQTLGLNAISAILGTWNIMFAISIGPEMGSRSLGYGGDTLNEKIFKRTVFALASLAVGGLLAYGAGFGSKAIIVLICQAVASVSSIILGVKNPLPAAVEEVFVCVSLKYFNYAYIFINFLN